MEDKINEWYKKIGLVKEKDIEIAELVIKNLSNKDSSQAKEIVRCLMISHCLPTLEDI